MDANRETSNCSDGAKEEKDIETNGNNNNYREEIKLRIKDDDKFSQASSPKKENARIGKEEDELESAKAEMSKMKEENERLKKMLEQIENEYRSLQMRFFDTLQHKTPPTKSPDTSQLSNETQLEEEPEISLCLGFRSPLKPKENNTSTLGKARQDTHLMSEGLSLGLEFKCPSKIDLSDEIEYAKGDETGETWPPSKVLKTMRSNEKEEELPETNNAKRARVSVRARCETPTMNDGCQWRKYGQKIAKGNPCPRAYYRCTVAPSCPVRKQVQRFSEDMSILVTTYEGTHNHPLPVAATAMASTTSAAASILMSGSSTSQGLGSYVGPTTTTTANLNGLNFTLYNNNNNNSRTGHFNLPGCPSSPTPPTITLDLTSTPSSHFNTRPPPSINFLSSPINYPTSRSLDFSSYPNYGSMTSNRNSIGSLSFGKSSQPPNQFSTFSPSSSQQFLTETLTKVLTSDPSFQSIVASAISSIEGSNNNNNNLRYGDQIQGISFNSLPEKSRPMPSSSNSQAAGSLMLMQPPFPFSLSKSSSTPDFRDQLK